MSATTTAFHQALPLDQHNRLLLTHVHPSDWKNPQPADNYNLVVVGGGTAGLVTAAGAAGLGAKVALIERALLGGDCLNVGCVPSKALIRAARAAADTRRAGIFGVRSGGTTTVDFAAVMERMRALRSQLSPHDSAARFRDLGIDVFLGDARFLGPRTLEVGGATLKFARACIATGARAAVPPTPGLADTGFLTNETVFSLTEMPRRIAILGGGPIGCELAQSFARFGAQVHLIEMAPHLLVREDPDAAERVQRALIDDGVQLVLSSKVARVHRAANGKCLSVESEGTIKELEVDEILVGVGRTPNVEGLGLEAAGVEFDVRTGVKVDDFMRTTSPRIFAAGDVASVYKFTHMADALARNVIQNALFFGRVRASSLIVPWCTYTDPEIAHVGIYPREATERGIEIDTFSVSMGQIDRAVLDGESDGMLKVHVARGTDRILGATMVARHAGESISEITLAMKAGIGLRTIASTIHPYPTQAEAIKRVGDLCQRERLTPRVKRLMSAFLAWRR